MYGQFNPQILNCVSAFQNDFLVLIFLAQVSLETVLRQGLKKGSCFIQCVQSWDSKDEKKGREERKDEHQCKTMLSRKQIIKDLSRPVKKTVCNHFVMSRKTPKGYSQECAPGTQEVHLHFQERAAMKPHATNQSVGKKKAEGFICLLLSHLLLFFIKGYPRYISYD